MLNAIDALTFVEFTLDIEQAVSEASPTNLIREPNISVLLNYLVQLGYFQNAREFLRIDRVAVITCLLREQKSTHFNFNLSRGVQNTDILRVSWLWELLQGNLFARA